MTKITELLKKPWFRILLFVAVVCLTVPVVMAFKLSGSYKKAVRHEKEGHLDIALATYAKLGSYRDANKRTDALLSTGNRRVIAAGENHMLVIVDGGRVAATGDNRAGQCETSDWSGVVSVAAGTDFSLGLKADGSLLYAGNPERAPTLTQGLAAVAAGGNSYALLKNDKTVIAYNTVLSPDTSKWKNIIAVGASQNIIVGLRRDGKVESCGSFEQDIARYKRVDVISVSPHCVLCLKSNGRTYSNNELYSNMYYWPEIDSFSAGYSHVVGAGYYTDNEEIKDERRISYSGSWISSEQGYLNEWTDVVAFAAGNAYTIGLTDEGMIRATGKNDFGQCNFNNRNIADLI